MSISIFWDGETLALFWEGYSD